MKPHPALAAGQSGSVSQSQPKPQDEAERLAAARELNGYLARGTTLLGRCETLASGKRGDHLGPILAAARLLNANARVATVLARVALVESRRRTIIETIQSDTPKSADLNSTFRGSGARDEVSAALERHLDQLLAAAATKDAP